MKKTLRNILVVLITIGIVFLLSGCGKNEEKSTNNANVTNEQIQEEKNAEFSMGEWKDNLYVNDFLGIKFKLPEGWAYSSEKQIADMMNLGSELLNDDQKVAEKVSKLTSAYYMVANDPNTGNNISIMSEKPVISVSTEYYMNQIKSQLSSLESISYEIGETSKEKIANREYDTLTVSASISSNEITQRYYIYKMDEYFVGIIVTSVTGESSIREMVESFQ